MAKVKLDDKTKFIKDLEQLELLWVIIESVKCFKYFEKHSEVLFYKVKHILLLVPVIL